MINRINLLKTLIAVVVFISFGLLIRATDMERVVFSIEQIGPRFIFLLTLTFIAYCFAAIGWKYCMGKQGQNLKLTDLFIIRHIGEMVSIVNPASVLGGEAVKVYLLQQKGVDKTNILASILISRVLMAATQIVLFLISLVLIFLSGNKTFTTLQNITFGHVIIAILLMILTVFAVYNNYFQQIFQKIKVYAEINTLIRKWKLKQVYIEFRGFFKTNSKGLLYATFFFSLHWLIGSMEIYFILLFLGIKVSVTAILLVDMGIVIFKAAGFFIPGQVGVEELGNKIMLEFIGVPNADIWVTVSILRRSRQLFWIAIGLLIYLIYTNRQKQPDTV